MFAALKSLLPRKSEAVSVEGFEALCQTAKDSGARFPLLAPVDKIDEAIKLRKGLVEVGVTKPEDQVGVLERIAKLNPESAAAIEVCKQALSPKGLGKRLASLSEAYKLLNCTERSELAGLIRTELSLMGSHDPRAHIRALNRLADDLGGKDKTGIQHCAEIIGLPGTRQRLGSGSPHVDSIAEASRYARAIKAEREYFVGIL